MAAFAAHFGYEFKAGMRSPSALLMNYLFPLGVYAMMGLVMTRINPFFKETLVPSMIVFGATGSALLGIPGPLVEAREAGVFRSFKINGVPAANIVSVPLLSTTFHIMIVAATIAVTGPLLFDAAPARSWPWLLAISIFTALLCSALGVLIGVISPTSRATVLLGQALFLPSTLIGGIMIPYAALPESIQPIAGLLPSTHAMQAMEGLAYGRPTAIDPAVSLLAMITATAIAWALSIVLFNWDSRNQSRRGHPALGLLALAPFALAMLAGR
jgi:ABC-2 type transport system permease protein